MRYFFIFIFPFFLFSEEDLSLLDFNSIKKILKSDQLDEALKIKRRKRRVKKKRRIYKAKKTYRIPKGGSFWNFYSQYWLVKNYQILRWDFEKVDYGIEKDLKNMLSQYGYYGKKIKILLINSSVLTHVGLPTKKNQYLLIVSLPFVQALKLKKLKLQCCFLKIFCV